MFLLAELSFAGLVGLIVVCCVALSIGRRACRSGGIFSPLRLLGIAAVIGGLSIFNTRSDHGLRWSVNWDDDAPAATTAVAEEDTGDLAPARPTEKSARNATVKKLASSASIKRRGG